MGNFAPAFLALLLNSFGIFIFINPTSFDCLPYFSYLIFLLSVFLMLWDVCIIPIHNRTLHCWAHFALEFTIYLFLMEFIVNDFWIPLEAAFISLLPKLSESLEDAFRFFRINPGILLDIIEVFKWPATLVICSYSLSIFFLFCIAHITKVIDLKLLRCGLSEFLGDAQRRTSFFVRNALKNGVCICPAQKYSCPKLASFPSDSARTHNSCDNCYYDDDDSEDCGSCDCSTCSRTSVDLCKELFKPKTCRYR